MGTRAIYTISCGMLQCFMFTLPIHIHSFITNSASLFNINHSYPIGLMTKSMQEHLCCRFRPCLVISQCQEFPESGRATKLHNSIHD